MLFQQNEDSGEVNEAQKRLGEFFVARGNPSKLFDFLPEAFNQMPFLVLPPVAFALYLVSFAAGDVRDRAVRYEPIDKGLAVVAAIGVDHTAVYRQSAQMMIGRVGFGGLPGVLATFSEKYFSILLHSPSVNS